MLKVSGLCKNYPTFSLKDISFEILEGYIYGFIGTNGAGKTTTLKSILNIVKADAGEIAIFGKDIYSGEIDIKQEVGFMLGEANYYSRTKIKVVVNVFKKFFSNWNEEVFNKYIRAFNIDMSKTIGQLSTGMRVKLSITFALSHNAKLLIFDEPTSGLDPIARNEILTIFRELVNEGDKSILFSTHITSDLDKCADYILFIKNGELIANETKDELIEKHRLIAGKANDLSTELKDKLIGIKRNSLGFSALIKDSDCSILKPHMQVERPNLEEIMIYYNEEEQQ